MAEIPSRLIALESKVMLHLLGAHAEVLAAVRTCLDSADAPRVSSYRGTGWTANSTAGCTAYRPIYCFGVNLTKQTSDTASVPRTVPGSPSG